MYHISSTDIVRIYEISHVSYDDIIHNRCIRKGYVPGRSFVFDSKLITMLGNSVISTDLETGEHLWAYNLENRSNTIDCVPQ